MGFPFITMKKNTKNDEYDDIVYIFEKCRIYHLLQASAAWMLIVWCVIDFLLLMCKFVCVGISYDNWCASALCHACTTDREFISLLVLFAYFLLSTEKLERKVRVLLHGRICN